MTEEWQKSARNLVDERSTGEATPKERVLTNHKVLFVQETPSLRNFRIAAALRSEGYKVGLAYLGEVDDSKTTGFDRSVFTDLFRMNDYRDLWAISNDFDIIHCQRGTGMLAVAALAGRIPVVVDVADSASAEDASPDGAFLVVVASKGAAGRVYSSDQFLKQAQSLHSPEGNSIVIEDHALPAEIWRLEKLYGGILGQGPSKDENQSYGDEKLSADASAEPMIHESATLNSIALAVSKAKTAPSSLVDDASATPKPTLIRPANWDDWVKTRYADFYQDKPGEDPKLEERLTGALQRYLGNEFQTAVDLGCGQGQYADFLQRQGKMVLGQDVVNRIAFPLVRFNQGPVWRLDEKVDLAYAIDLLQHIPDEMVQPSLKAIAEHCRMFFTETALVPSGDVDSQGNDLHVNLKPPQWWLRQLAGHFAEVKLLAITKNWFWAEACHDPRGIVDFGRMQGYQGWEQVTRQPVTPYRELWDRHARSLPWKGKLLYIGSNHLCRQYYNSQFFQVDEVLHIDPDPKNLPDVVTIGENLGMFADGSVDGVAFFGTPYLMNDPQKFVQEAKRVLKHGGLFSGSFNGPTSRWQGLAYQKGKVKSSDEIWHFQRDILDLFDDWTVLYWACQGDEYYHLSAVKM